MLQHVPETSLLQRPEFTVPNESHSQRPFEFACTFFKIADKSISAIATSETSAMPFSACFHSVVALSLSYNSCLIKEPQHAAILRESLCRVLTVIERLVARLIAPMNIAWNPKEWLSSLLASLEYKVCTSFFFSMYLTPPTDYYIYNC